jgi:hypothetical protein
MMASGKDIGLLDELGAVNGTDLVCDAGDPSGIPLPVPINDRMRLVSEENDWALWLRSSLATLWRCCDRPRRLRSRSTDKVHDRVSKSAICQAREKVGRQKHSGPRALMLLNRHALLVTESDDGVRQRFRSGSVPGPRHC